MADWTEHKAVAPTVSILKWALTFVLTYQLAVLTWMIVDQPVLVLPEPSKGKAAQAKNESYDIASWHLFGDAADVPVVPQEEISAPETRLRLVLMGVFMSPNKEQSSAIIAEQGREGEFFLVGDRVQGRARLAQVYEDKVILDNSGKLETLTFEDAAKGASSGFKSAPKKATPKRSNGKRTNKDFRKKLTKIRTPEDFVKFAKDELESDPYQAMENVGLKQSGDGYEVTENASMLKNLGMKPGDKLISINGQPLGDPTSDKELIDEVYAQGNARIEVERDGRRFVVNHQFK